MPYSQLWILLEGNDDERLFEIIRPVFERKYDSVRSWKYAKQTTKRIKNFIKSINAMRADYFFMADINTKPCITAKKRGLMSDFEPHLDENKIIIVIQEIESWCLAGLTKKTCQELKIRSFSSTDGVTKEDFNKLIQKKFDSHVDFIVEILKRFKVGTAKRKNKSFRYFMNKV